MKKIAIWLVKVYINHIAPLKKYPSCVFIPSCPEYSIEAFEKYGFLKGLRLTIRRISRCHPWQKNRYDPLL
jgi:putative membrane protein insertion efficiency factor